MRPGFARQGGAAPSAAADTGLVADGRAGVVLPFGLHLEAAVRQRGMTACCVSAGLTPVNYIKGALNGDEGSPVAKTRVAMEWPERLGQYLAETGVTR
jgi:hypothetical protein